jgi:hypothetical protein
MSANLDRLFLDFSARKPLQLAARSAYVFSASARSAAGSRTPT